MSIKPNKIILIHALILLSQLLIAQKKPINEYQLTDKKALLLPDSLSTTTENIAKYISSNFSTENDKTRAIFIWLATNIEYDIENVFALNFYEKREDKISKTLKSRKGICANYAALFNDICSRSGVKSFVVEGYTKQNGFTDYIPHAWCAARIDSSWFLFDPTWGSGYINGGKFFKKINNTYNKADPATLITTHMPFDHLWQFLNYPISNQEFYEGKIQQNNTKPYFNFVDSITVYEKQNHIEQLTSTAIRIEKNGLKNSMIFDRLQHIKLELENDRQTKIVNLYNGAAADYNEGVNNYNTFINYRNKQFVPEKPDTEIQKMLDDADIKLKETKNKLSKIDKPDQNVSNMMKQLTKAVDDVTIQLNEQQDWLKLYFSKNKSGRKSMLYERKITWFGIPIN